MHDISRRCLGFSLAIALLSAAPAVAATPPTDTLFPEQTRFYLQIVNYPQLKESWDATAFEKIFDDPAMQPFLDDIEEQIKAKRDKDNKDFGISRDDIEGMSTGELGLAVVETSDGKAALCILTDVTGKEAQAKTVLEKIETDLEKQKGKRKVERVGGASLITYDLPPKEGSKQKRQAAFFLRGTTFGAFEDIAVGKTVLARLDASGKGGLANVAAYQAAFKRVVADAGTLKPEIRFFVNPLPLAFAMRNSRDDPSPRGDVDLLKTLNKQGFTALKGIAGHVNLNVDGEDFTYRVALLAPQPYELAMKMMSFPNTADLPTPGWIASDVSMYIAFNMDMQNAFDHFGPIFNDLFGDGDSGAWDEVLEGLRIDEDGPQIDLKKELIKFLGTRAYVIADIETPITPTSQRRLVALKLTDSVQFANALDRVMENDPDVKPHPPVNGIKIFELLPVDEEEEEEEVPRRRRRAGGGAVAAAPAKPKRRAAKANVPVENSAVCVAHGHFLIATQIDYLKEVLNQPSKVLKDDAAFQAMTAKLGKKRPAQISSRGFSNLAMQFQTGYELFRAGRWRENDRMAARFIRETLSDGDPDDLKPRYDASKLPPYEVVAKYLGYGSSYVVSEDQGWFVFGFASGKK